MQKKPHYKRKTMKTITLNHQPLDFSTPVVMGILNITPDSFYDGGKYMSETAIIRRIHQIVEEGAGIIDIGAYSTRPGADFVDEREELGRLDWGVELVRKYYPELPISIDTFRSGVAKEIIGCMGEVMVNDISGGMMDESMFDFVAETGVPYILMHIQGTPQTMQQNPVYDDVVKEVGDFFRERIALLQAKGFDNIILVSESGLRYCRQKVLITSSLTLALALVRPWHTTIL